MIRQAPSIAKDFKSSFFSYEKDVEIIIKKLFTENRYYADSLKRLLVINQPDCLTSSNASYNKIIQQYSVKRLRDEGYVRMVPRLALEEHEDIKSILIIMLDNIDPTENPEYRSCLVNIFIFSEYEFAQMDNYQYRPVKIAGYVDGILNGAKLTNIGELEFNGMQHVPLNEFWGGVCLQYRAVHSDEEDKNPNIPAQNQ